MLPIILLRGLQLNIMPRASYRCRHVGCVLYELWQEHQDYPTRVLQTTTYCQCAKLLSCCSILKINNFKLIAFSVSSPQVNYRLAHLGWNSKSIHRRHHKAQFTIWHNGLWCAVSPSRWCSSQHKAALGYTWILSLYHFASCSYVWSQKNN